MGGDEFLQPRHCRTVGAARAHEARFRSPRGALSEAAVGEAVDVGMIPNIVIASSITGRCSSSSARSISNSVVDRQTMAGGQVVDIRSRLLHPCRVHIAWP